MSERPLIKESLTVLNICGLNPTNQNGWSKLRAIITIALLISWVVELALEFSYDWKGWKSAKAIMTCGAGTQALIKTLYILAYNGKIAELIGKVDMFWSLEGLDKDFELKMKYLTKFGKSSISAFYFFTLATLTLFVLKPLVTSGRSLPFETYHPVNHNEKYTYGLMYFLQIIDGLAAQSSAVGYDILFMSFIIQVVFELKVIKHKFATIAVKGDLRRENESLKEVCELVRHHNLVLRCIKRMSHIYSFYLLIQFSTSTGFICTTLLGMVASGFPPTLEDLAQYLSFLASALSQLFVYCVAGTYLMVESESVAEAVYDSDWWAKTQPKFRRACVLVIQRSNKTECLTAGGMFTLNLENFTRIVRLGLSVFSLAQAVSTGN